jgi:hypothetical protein
MRFSLEGKNFFSNKKKGTVRFFLSRLEVPAMEDISSLFLAVYTVQFA